MVNNVNSKDMKKKMILAILLIIVGVACERIIIDPPVVEPIYTVEASAENGTFTPSFMEVYKGGKTTLTLKSNDGFDPDSVFINGIVDNSLKGETTFNFLNIDGNIKVQAICKMNKWGILMNGPWKTLESFKRDIGTTQWTKIPNSTLRDIYIFNITRYSVLDISGIEVGNGNYSFDLKTDSLIVGGLRYKITSLILGEETNEMKILRLDKFYSGTVRVPSKDEEKLFVLTQNVKK